MVSNTTKKKLLRVSELDEKSDTYTMSAYLVAQLGKNFSENKGREITGEELLKLAWDKIEEMQYLGGGMVTFLEAENVAVEDGYMRTNISDNLLKELKQSHNTGAEHRRALTVPEQELFLDFLNKENTPYHHWDPIFRVMLYTGMRVGEITGLRWEDIDLDKEMIEVNHTLVYYNHAENGCYFSIHTPKTKAGNLQHQGTLNKALRRIIRDCNDMQLAGKEKNPVLLPRFSCHSLRHTFTTRLVEADVNLKVV